MPRVMYLGLQAFANEPQQLLPTAENPQACQSLVSKGQPSPLQHQGELLVEQLDEEGLRSLEAWLKEDVKRQITIAWPQPQHWLAATLTAGEAIQEALTTWQQQAKSLIALFRSARRQVVLVGYVPGMALKTIAAPQEQHALPPIYQLTAAQLISHQAALQETYKYLQASSQEQAIADSNTVLLATQALKEHAALKIAETEKVTHEQQIKDLQEEEDLLLQQLHTVQEAYENLFNEKTGLEKNQRKDQEALTKLKHEYEAATSANQNNLNVVVNKLEQRVAQLHKTQEQLEKSHQAQSKLRDKVETRQKELKKLNENSQAHIQHLERMVQWLRVNAQRHAAAAYREIRSYKKALPKQAAMLEASEFFDAQWYLEQYPDVAKANIKPAEHFIKFGAMDGRDPGPLFNTSFYLTHYSDVAASGQHPLLHYLRHGINEQRQVRPEQQQLAASANTASKENA